MCMQQDDGRFCSVCCHFCNNGMVEELGRSSEKCADDVVTRSLLTPNLRDFEAAFFSSCITDSEGAHAIISENYEANLSLCLMNGKLFIHGFCFL